MTVDIREYDEADHDAILHVALRAWAPVFASLDAVLGVTTARRLHGQDWPGIKHGR
jgi:hypothetical protein